MRRSGFSLASLFVLIAVAAVLASAIQMAVRHGRLESGLAVAMAAVVGPLIGLIVGLAMGIARGESFWGVTTSTLTGLVGGAMAGILMVVPESIWAIVVGSAMIVLFALIVRRFSRRALEQRNSDLASSDLAQGTKS